MSEVQHYLDWGFSVIPLRLGTKRPALDSWDEFQSRRPTPDEMQRWWGNGHQHGVAIVCGKVSGVVVLDIDDPEKFGVALKVIGETLPDTPIVRTRKGWHLYFRYPTNRIVRRHDRLDDWGAELRGDGCYVVAPPSVVDGHGYTWATRKGKRMALGEVPIAECPKWLLDAFGVPFADEQNEPTPVQHSTQQVPQPTDGKGDTLSDEQKRALKSVLVPHWVEGQRHDLALGLAGLLAKSGIAQEDALALLREIAKEAGDPEWCDRERALKDSFDRLWEGKEIIGYRRLEEVIGEQTTTLIATIVQPRTSQKVKPASAQAIRELAAQATEVIPQQPTQGKRLPDAVWIPLREIARPDPNEQWQVDGLMKAGNLVILSARPKTAKSIVGLNLAACVATGRPFLNRPTQQGRALSVAWERHDLTVQRAFTMGLDVCEDFMIWDRCRFGIAPRVDVLDWWREFITTHDIRLVVFDTLAHFLRPELDKVRNAINAYDHIAGIMERIAQTADETRCTFVFVHHDRKGEGDTDEQRVLGTTALTAAADVVLQLQPIGDDAGVTMLKATGNAIEDQLLYFAIRPDFWLEPTERPAVAKEDKAARALVDYLRQHEQAKRKDLEAYLRDIGLAESASAAEKLFERALPQLHGKIIRTQRGTYTLAPDFRHSDTPIRDVGVVGNAEPLSDISDITPMSEVSEMSETPSRFPTKPTNPIVSSESREDDNGQDWQWDWFASDTPILPELVTPANPPIACHRDEQVVQYPPSPCCSEPIEPNEDGIGVCVGCGRRWQWTGASWRSADPSEGDAPPVEDRGDNLSPRKGDPPDSSAPTPANAPQPDQPDPASPTDPNSADRPPQPDQPDAEFVDAEAWLDQWASDAPKVVDIETGEAISLTPTREESLRRLPDSIACCCGAALRAIGRSYTCPRCRQPLPTTCRRCGRVLRVVSEGRAECVGCGLLHTFDRSRCLWLTDDDPI
jgi:hypothetical protein